MGDHFLHKIMFFQAPFLAEKGPWPSRGPNLGSGVPKMVPGIENTKLAYSKTMQNPVVGIANGAICCKLWPKTISGWMGQNLCNKNDLGRCSGEPQGSLWVAWGISWELVRFWTPFSEKMFQNHNVLHGLGAGRNLKAEQADQADPSRSSGSGAQLAVSTLGSSRLRPG